MRTKRITAALLGLVLLTGGSVVASGGVAVAAGGVAAGAALDTTPPPAPSVRASVVARTVTLTWSAVAASDLAGYLVYRSDRTPVTLDPAHLRSTAAPFNALTFNDYPPATGATYHYVVVAVDTSGNRSASVAVAVVSRDLTPPPVPTGVTGFIDPVTLELTVSWNPRAATDTETVGYRICWGSVPNDPCFYDASAPLITGYSYTVQLTGTSPVHLRVGAEDAAYQRSWSPLTTIGAPGTTP
ncbi:hypothetical protein OG349_08495 [Streptomyces sp. NBC_01317]|uniref:hypothetical protein n=1 Tax=Streptomyces sp. NBC_01317 TaxID=2903822 RepID=UPI002E0FE7C7|nr:hypothetical protein OG349_08495 [Streptomyces sp. NBC_01317]